jgi:hypothetical protein
MPARIVMNLGMYIVPPEAIAAEYGVPVSNNTKLQPLKFDFVTSLRMRPEVPFYLSR